MEEEVTISFSDDGPYIVKGPVKLVDQDGKEVPLNPVIALCRCGGSSTKPFCDGTHSKIGFAAAETARDDFDRNQPDQDAQG